MKKLYFLFLLLILIGFFPGQGRAGHDTYFSNQSSFSILIDKKDASSAEARDGSIHLKIQGGKAPYSIHCFNPYSTPIKFTGENVTMESLGTGVYLFIIQDSSGHIESKEIKIDAL